MKLKLVMFLLACVFFFTSSVFADPDPNFYVFLCFGQSNMEGYPGIPEAEKNIDKYEGRFQVLAAVDFQTPSRKKDSWYPAIPPLCRSGCGMCPADYFGRTLVENLPKNIKIGVINVSVAGCKIEMFDKANYQAYLDERGTADWLRNIAKQYDGNPYQKLVDMGKLAQKDGVIKGILLHQGESNSGEKQWGAKVKGVYDNLIKDLDLKADQTPLLVGELTNGGGGAMIAEVPKLVPNSYVIPSKGCATAPGNTIHFGPEGYKELGKRYAAKMLELLGHPIKDAAGPATQPANP
jgi:hypothetical protein